MRRGSSMLIGLCGLLLAQSMVVAVPHNHGPKATLGDHTTSTLGAQPPQGSVARCLACALHVQNLADTPQTLPDRNLAYAVLLLPGKLVASSPEHALSRRSRAPPSS